jgi:type I pantothenate kinase
MPNDDTLVSRRILELLEATQPVVVALTGPVGVGKTTYAHVLSEELRHHTSRNLATVISTDGFLLPNSTLEELGLIDQKGFPRTFDTDALAWFLQTVRCDTAIVGLPRYSHEHFDITPSNDIFHVTPVVIIEGVNALQPVIANEADLCVYIDADIEHVIEWFTGRFEQFTEQARSSGEGFYLRFADLSPDDLRSTARSVYDTINRPNLEQHIAPTQRVADIIVMKTLDHGSRAFFTKKGERHHHLDE